jgi:hypothetical protein
MIKIKQNKDKFNTKLTSEISDRDRKESLFPGWEIFKQASNGIMESEEELEEEKKEKKKFCTKGAPYHGKDGRFVDPNKEPGSVSIGNKSKKTGCKKGKAKRPAANRGEQWTSIPCGRADVDSPNKKAKHKCKGGLNEDDGWEGKYKEFVAETEYHSLGKESDEAVKVDLDSKYRIAKEFQEKQFLIKRLKLKIKEMEKTKAKSCPLSYASVLNIVRNLELAQKGSSEVEAAAKLAKERRSK